METVIEGEDVGEVEGEVEEETETGSNDEGGHTVDG